MNMPLSCCGAVRAHADPKIFRGRGFDGYLRLLVDLLHVYGNFIMYIWRILNFAGVTPVATPLDSQLRRLYCVYLDILHY